MYNGTLTIAYHMRYFNKQRSQSSTDTITNQLSSKVSTSSKKIIAYTTSVSSNTNIASKKKSSENFSTVTQDHDDPHHITHSNMPSRSKPTHSATRHSPVIKLIAQVHEQKDKIHDLMTQLKSL